MAVITGSVGGVVLVVGLIATYCYCFPLARRGISRKDRAVATGRVIAGDDKDTHKCDGNGAGPLVNGGSLVVTSASRGSVLLNVSGDTGPKNGAGNEASQSLMLRQRQGDGDGDDHPINGINMNDNSVGGARNEEFPRALEPQFRHTNESANDNNHRTLSMSIPDVTRVEPQGGGSHPVQAETTQPQFFTLGRLANRSNNATSEASLRHSFHDRAGGSCVGAVNLDARSDIKTTLSRYRQQEHAEQQYPSMQQQHFNPRLTNQLSNNGVNPFTALYRTTSSTDQREGSDGGSLYRDGSIGGDSINGEGLLCDDRTASPPPPAPTGSAPETTRTSPYAPLNRRSLAMI